MGRHQGQHDTNHPWITSRLNLDFSFKMNFIPKAPNMMARLTNLGGKKLGNSPSALEPKISQTCWPSFFAISFLRKTPRGIVGNLAIEKGLFLGNQKPYYTILCCGPTSLVPTYSLCFLYHQPLSHTSIRSPINPQDVQVDQTNRGWSLGWSICSEDSLLLPIQMDFQGIPFSPATAPKPPTWQKKSPATEATTKAVSSCPSVTKSHSRSVGFKASKKTQLTYWVQWDPGRTKNYRF